MFNSVYFVLLILSLVLMTTLLVVGIIRLRRNQECKKILIASMISGIIPLVIVVVMFIGVLSGMKDVSTMPLGVNLSAVDYDSGVLWIMIDNQSGYTFDYDKNFTLYHQVNGEWIELQRTQALSSEMYEVQSVDDMKKTLMDCDLNLYGEIADGSYKINLDVFETQFKIKKGKLSK